MRREERAMERETTPSELLGATDQQIEDAVGYADPMALRGLLYQLTGDERVADTAVTSQASIDAAALADQADVARLRMKAAELLKAYRDAGAGPIDVGPLER